jgi:putative DNA-invertase from lambdoid prophage Rac
MSKLFLTIAAAFAEAERDRIRERIRSIEGRSEGPRPIPRWEGFGYRRGESGDLVPYEVEQEAIREIVSLRAQGKALRAIAQAIGFAALGLLGYRKTRSDNALA